MAYSLVQLGLNTNTMSKMLEQGLPELVAVQLYLLNLLRRL